MEPSMKRTPLFLFIVVAVLTSCTQTKISSDYEADEKKIYKNWVLSRCLSYAFPSEPINQDALNSASAYLEQSKLPVEAFLAAEPIIKKIIEKNSQGSISGSFKVKNCLDLFHSSELENLFLKGSKNLKRWE